MSLPIRTAACLAAVSLLTGCAGHRKQGFGQFVKRGGQAAEASSPTLPGESLEDYITKVRQLATTARPPQIPAATAIENQDSQLRTARAILTLAPTSENHRRVAEAYARLGILDQAFDHFNAALRMNGTDAAAYDGLARVWREWGYPHLGLGDAHRAVYYAPLSPVARNTLGTVLLALGQNREVQAAFELALVLDSNASYALNNLCHVAVSREPSADAVDACHSALRAQPVLAASLKAADEQRSVSGDPAVARYKAGVVLLAKRDFRKAAQAFDDASTLRMLFANLGNRAGQTARIVDATGAPATPDERR